MAGQETVITKKRGPKPTGKGQMIGLRLQPDQLAALDGWINEQPEDLTRPEAIRKILQDRLSHR